MKLFIIIKRWFKFQLTNGGVMYAKGMPFGRVRRSMCRSYVNK